MELLKKKYTIVIADDSIFMREYLKKLINKDERFEVIGEAEDGYLAIDEAEKLPDLMTLDITMNNFGGLLALPKVLEVSPNTKVIMVSAVSKRSNIIKAIQLGASEFIAKPFEKEKVLEVLKKVLNI